MLSVSAGTPDCIRANPPASAARSRAYSLRASYLPRVYSGLGPRWASGRCARSYAGVPEQPRGLLIIPLPKAPGRRVVAAQRRLQLRWQAVVPFCALLSDVGSLVGTREMSRWADGHTPLPSAGSLHSQGQPPTLQVPPASPE